MKKQNCSNTWSAHWSLQEESKLMLKDVKENQNVKETMRAGLCWIVKANQKWQPER